MDTVGIRVPDNRVILGLAEISGRPLTATSANISGKPAPYEISEITAQMGSMIDSVPLLLDQGGISPREVSTIVDLTQSPPRLLRKGRIPWQEIEDVLSGEIKRERG